MALFGLGSVGTSALKTGAKKADKDLSMGISKGNKALKLGQEQYTPRFEEAANTYAPFIQNGVGLNNLYTGELSGDPNFVSQFQKTPGYDFLQQQGEQAALRNNAAIGGVASGNTLTDLAKFDTGLADQTYQQYLDNLFRGSAQGLQGAQGKASALTQLGSQIGQTAGQRADVFTSGFGAKATNQSNLGAQIQSQNAANQASQLSLLQSILGAGAKIGGSFLA